MPYGAVVIDRTRPGRAHDSWPYIIRNLEKWASLLSVNSKTVVAFISIHFAAFPRAENDLFLSLTVTTERRSLQVSKGHDQIFARAMDSVHLSSEPWYLKEGGLIG